MLVFTMAMQSSSANHAALDRTQGIANKVGIQTFAIRAFIKRHQGVTQEVPGIRCLVFIGTVEGYLLFGLIDRALLGLPSGLAGKAVFPGSQECRQSFIGFVGLRGKVLAA